MTSDCPSWCDLKPDHPIESHSRRCMFVDKRGDRCCMVDGHDAPHAFTRHHSSSPWRVA